MIEVIRSVRTIESTHRESTKDSRVNITIGIVVNRNDLILVIGLVDPIIGVKLSDASFGIYDTRISKSHRLRGLKVDVSRSEYFA